MGQHLRPLAPALYRSTVDISDSDVAIAAVQRGSAIVRAKYGRAPARFDKSPTDFATAADIEAEEAILETLRAARAEDTLVGEETGHHGPAVLDADGWSTSTSTDPSRTPARSARFSCSQTQSSRNIFRPRVLSTTLALVGSQLDAEPPT